MGTRGWTVRWQRGRGQEPASRRREVALSFSSSILITPAERAALLGLDRPTPRSRTPWPRDRAVRGTERQEVTLRLDADLIDWFKRDGGGARGMQARINAALRAHVADREDSQ